MQSRRRDAQMRSCSYLQVDAPGPYPECRALKNVGAQKAAGN